jgi:hypothetical protein
MSSRGVAAVKGSRRVVWCGLRFVVIAAVSPQKGIPPTMFREFKRLCPFRPLPPEPRSPGYSAATQ